MTIGIALNVAEDASHLDAARRIEALGYSAIWISGGQLSTLDLIPSLIRATRSLRVGTAIIPPRVYAAEQVATTFAAAEADDPGRFVVGLGGSQGPNALAALGDYLDRLDSAVPPVPADRRILAALGPRKLALARERFAGAITLLVTPEYTAWARKILGPDARLIVDELVAVDPDLARGRASARERLEFLSRVPGYAANFARMGFGADEVAGLSDRLVDAVTALGDVEAVTARVERQLAAGADEIMLSAIGPNADPVQLAETFAAAALGDRRRTRPDH